MIVLYKNKDDSMKIHTGTLMTDIRKLEKALYCDVIPLGNVVNGELDWKNRHIQDVGMEFILAIANNREALEKGMPEYFL